MSKDYDDFKEEVQSEQQGKDYDEIKREMQQFNRHLVELDRLQPQEHRWIDRGAVMSCEFAGHPHHRSFKIGG